MPLLSSGRNSSELVKKWAKHNWSLAGLLFVYIACFLTESEEHEIVDHLSTWWITIKDRQQAAESGLAAFLAGITGFTSFVLDRLFGQKLLTTRGGGGLALLVGPTNSVVISASFSTAKQSHQIASIGSTIALASLKSLGLTGPLAGSS